MRKMPLRYLAVIAYSSVVCPINQITHWFSELPTSERLSECIEGSGESVILIDTHNMATIAYSHYGEIMWVEEGEFTNG